MDDSDPRYGSNEFAAALGRTIKVLRTDRALERKELADRAGISYSHLASIETGQKQPSPQVLTAIADALGIASHELLESVEFRRRRGGRPDNPWWLTDDAPPPAMRLAAPRAMQFAQSPPPAAGAGDLGDFVRELAAVAERLTPRDRLALLDLAHRLARQYGSRPE